MSTFVSCPVQNACGASKLYRPNQQQEQSIKTFEYVPTELGLEVIGKAFNE